jgi:hypothetical protein
MKMICKRILLIRTNGYKYWYTNSSCIKEECVFIPMSLRMKVGLVKTKKVVDPKGRVIFDYFDRKWGCQNART